MVTVTTESRATLRTSLGNLVLEFISDKAPRTCENFATLAKKGFYDGTTFHRIIKDFIVQGGCPHGNGKGGPGYTIRPEFNDTPHEAGVVSMARDNDPHSAGSQFFIVAGEARYLDSRYTAFARVVDGMDVLEKMAAVSTDIQPKYKEKSVPLDPVYLNGVDLEGVEFPVEEPSQSNGSGPAAEPSGESGGESKGDPGGESSRQGGGEGSSSSSGGRRSRRGRGRRGRSGGDRGSSSAERGDSSGEASSTENKAADNQAAAPEAKNDSAPAPEAPAKGAKAQPAEPAAASDAPTAKADEKPAAKKATRKKATRKKAVAKDKSADGDDKPAAPAKKKATRKKAVRKKPASDAGSDEG